MKELHDISVGGFRYLGPAPEDIGQIDIRTTLTSCRDVRDGRDRAILRRNAAADLRAALVNRGGQHLAELLAANPFATVENPNDELIAATHAEEDEQRHIDGFVGAEGLVLNAYRRAVDKGRAQWGKQLAAKVPPAVAKITTAVRMLESAQDELAENLGMLSGLAEGSYRTSNRAPYAVPLSVAIDNAIQAIALATDAFETAKADLKAATS